MIHTDHSLKNKLRHHSLKDLCALYEINIKTLKKWLLPFEKEIGKKNGRFYNINQVKVIFTYLGTPNNYFDDERWFKQK